MLSQTKLANARIYRVTQLIAACLSLLFVGLIGLGYYLLLQKNAFAAVCISSLLAATAWFLAKYLGSSEGGIPKHLPFFAFLLVIRALGVFNSLMLNLEGKRIFQEAIDDSEQRFIKLELATLKYLENPAIATKIAKIESLSETLIKEILNPRNCGQGPEAILIMDEIRKELPEFRPLSGKNDCTKNQQIASDYKETILDLTVKSKWFTESNYGALIETRKGIVANADGAKSKLRLLRGEVNTNLVPTLLKSVSPKLEDLGSLYRTDVERLKRFSPGEDVPRTLDLSSVGNLGEWSQIVNLVISRIDKPTTYIYLILAGFIDWLMIYAFRLVRINATGNFNRTTGTSIGSPWARKV